MTTTAAQLDWVLTDFANRVSGVSNAAVVSSDGLPLASSEALPRDAADKIAAIASGLASLTNGAARAFKAGRVIQTIVEMERGFLFLVGVSDGSLIAALTAPSADLGLVGHELVLLVDRVGPALTPELRAEVHGRMTS